MNSFLLRAAIVGLAVQSLVGCATKVEPVKDVVANADGYLTRFAPSALPADVLAKLPKNESPVAFNRMEVLMDMTEVRSDQKADRALSMRGVFVNAGNGLVESYSGMRSNQIPYRLNYRLTYRGFLALKWQTVFLTRDSTDIASEVKILKRIDVVPAALASQTVEFGATYGTVVQLGNYRDWREVCTFGNRRPASQLSASLAGDAFDLACDNFGSNGQITGKTGYVYLERYGIGLQQSYVDSTIRTTNTLKSVTIQ
jgi:hypothetical protein